MEPTWPSPTPVICITPAFNSSMTTTSHPSGSSSRIASSSSLKHRSTLANDRIASALGKVTGAPETGLLLEYLFRHQAGRMVAHFTRLLGPARIELAEESVQEAMLRALQTWPYSGVPENAPAWLFRVAHNF